MKATEAIVKLQELINEHGDCDVYYYDTEQITGFDSADVIEVKQYGFGNEAKVFYIE